MWTAVGPCDSLDEFNFARFMSRTAALFSGFVFDSMTAFDFGLSRSFQEILRAPNGTFLGDDSWESCILRGLKDTFAGAQGAFDALIPVGDNFAIPTDSNSIQAGNWLLFRALAGGIRPVFQMLVRRAHDSNIPTLEGQEGSFLKRGSLKKKKYGNILAYSGEWRRIRTDNTTTEKDSNTSGRIRGEFHNAGFSQAPIE